MLREREVFLLSRRRVEELEALCRSPWRRRRHIRGASLESACGRGIGDRNGTSAGVAISCRARRLDAITVNSID
jgi:hypothetical protein